MKKSLILLSIVLLGLIYVVSCKKADNNNDLYIGHIRIEKNTLYFDEVEWITLENKSRIEELELIPREDMPNGYYIYNPSSEIVSFEVNEKTIYNFIDWGNDFVSEGEDRNYSTTDLEEFIKYLNTYTDKAAKVPFWIETKDGYVISITEEFVN